MGIHPLVQMKEAVVSGKAIIKEKLAMAAVCQKYGNKEEENRYFQSACEINTRVVNLEAQIKMIESAINKL